MTPETHSSGKGHGEGREAVLQHELKHCIWAFSYSTTLITQTLFMYYFTFMLLVT